jgi:hypothetical protein
MSGESTGRRIGWKDGEEHATIVTHSKLGVNDTLKLKLLSSVAGLNAAVSGYHKKNKNNLKPTPFSLLQLRARSRVRSCVRLPMLHTARPDYESLGLSTFSPFLCFCPSQQQRRQPCPWAFPWSSPGPCPSARRRTCLPSPFARRGGEHTDRRLYT